MVAVFWRVFSLFLWVFLPCLLSSPLGFLGVSSLSSSGLHAWMGFPLRPILKGEGEHLWPPKVNSRKRRWFAPLAFLAFPGLAWLFEASLAWLG